MSDTVIVGFGALVVNTLTMWIVASRAAAKIEGATSVRLDAHTDELKRLGGVDDQQWSAITDCRKEISVLDGVTRVLGTRSDGMEKRLTKIEDRCEERAFACDDSKKGR